VSSVRLESLVRLHLSEVADLVLPRCSGAGTKCEQSLKTVRHVLASSMNQGRSTLGQPGVNLRSSWVEHGVNMGSTCGQHEVNMGSTWGQPGVNLGSVYTALPCHSIAHVRGVQPLREIRHCPHLLLVGSQLPLALSLPSGSYTLVRPA